jgi:hypothetical protein
MSSTYDLVEEDFIHENPSSTLNIQEDFITTDPSENDLVVDPHIDETPISVEQGQTGTVTCSKKLCRILPTPICKNNLLQMRHERSKQFPSGRLEIAYYKIQGNI